MALTSSNPFEIGTKAPSFRLINTVDKQWISLDDLKGEKGTALMFICNHCPFVIHVNSELVQLAKDYQDRGISFIAISSNDIERYPEDAPDKMKQMAQQLAYPFPYLYDEDQEVAKAYDAACTPDFYLFDDELKAVYHGQLDSSRLGNGIEVNGEDFRAAIDQLLNAKAPLEEQKASVGCGIKWK
jgi:peroxiredoxin